MRRILKVLHIDLKASLENEKKKEKRLFMSQFKHLPGCFITSSSLHLGSLSGEGPRQLQI